MFFEMLGGIFFLLIGLCGCLYPFLFRVPPNENFSAPKKFAKSDNMYCDGDNT